MGQFISTTRTNTCNDELINSLVKREFIRTSNVEKVLRCVDRGFYYSDEDKLNAYRDSAWQSDQIHLSAPCVYASVLENLELKSGLKFLNIGSGIGYFSTVAGLLLGRNGVNHGIEIRELLINHAYEKVEEFKLSCAAIDYFDFCEPIFIQGNACDLLQTGYYDRVYCGAGVPPEESLFMKCLIKVGGILVMPIDGWLVQITRKEENVWQSLNILEVSFTDLVISDKCNFNTVNFPPVAPLSLQELCRSNIRSLLREKLQKTFPHLVMNTKCESKVITEGSKRLNVANQFVRIQYGVSEEGLVTIRHIVDTYAGTGGVRSDTGSVTDDELLENFVEEDPEVITEREAQTVERLYNRYKNSSNAQTSFDESTKRKSPETVGCSEQNKTTETKEENPKRMKIDSSSQKTDSLPSTSSQSPVWETVSPSNSSLTNEDSETDVENESEDFIERRRNYVRVYNSLFSENSSDSDEPDVVADKDSLLYTHIDERKFNNMSSYLKKEIDLLPIPVLLKHFLNYNTID